MAVMDRMGKLWLDKLTGTNAQKWMVWSPHVQPPAPGHPYDTFNKTAQRSVISSIINNLTGGGRGGLRDKAVAAQPDFGGGFV